MSHSSKTLCLWRVQSIVYGFLYHYYLEVCLWRTNLFLYLKAWEKIAIALSLAGEQGESKNKFLSFISASSKLFRFESHTGLVRYDLTVLFKKTVASRLIEFPGG